MKKCIISLGINGDSPKNSPPKIWQDFPKGIRRIRQSLETCGFDGEFIGWDERYPPGAPSFAEVHGAAKPFCFIDAHERGFELVLWVDASIRFDRPPDPLFDIVMQKGYLITREHHSLGEYCSDAALRMLEVDREESFSMPSCRSAVVGLDLRERRCRELLSRWKETALDGVTFSGAKWSGVRGFPPTVSTDPRVKGHRHDQAVLSILAHQMELTDWTPWSEVGEILSHDREFVRRYDEHGGGDDGMS